MVDNCYQSDTEGISLEVTKGCISSPHQQGRLALIYPSRVFGPKNTYTHAKNDDFPRQSLWSKAAAS